MAQSDKPQAYYLEEITPILSKCHNVFTSCQRILRHIFGVHFNCEKICLSHKKWGYFSKQKKQRVGRREATTLESPPLRLPLAIRGTQRGYSSKHHLT